MADNSLLVTISNAALSLLYYESIRNSRDQMGFLLGETHDYVIRKFTDSDIQVETVKMHINIETVMACPTLDLLDDSLGRIHKEKLKDFVRDKSKQIIGWFRFRRNACLVPSLRDKLLHKQFSSHFTNGNGCKEELFLMCLLTSSTSIIKGTHKFRHVFLMQNRGMFEAVPAKINNLGDDASRHDGSDYKPTPAKKSLHEPDIFTKLIDDLNLDLSKPFGVETATAIEKAAEQYLDTLIPRVCDSECEVADLERQVQELRAKIFARNVTKKFKFDRNSDTTGSNYALDVSSDTENGRISEKNDHLSMRIESPGKIFDNSTLLKEYTTSTNRTITSHKGRNTAVSMDPNFSVDISNDGDNGGTSERNEHPSSRIDPRGKFSGDTPLLKDCAISTGPGISSDKTRNTAASIAKTLNQERSRRLALGTDLQTSQPRDPLANIVSEMQMDIAEHTPNRNKKSTVTISEIAKQSICKGGQMEARGRGSGRGAHVVSPGIRKSRHPSSFNTQCSERNSQIVDQNPPESNTVQNYGPPPLQMAYSQAARKNLTNTRSVPDTSDSR